MAGSRSPLIIGLRNEERGNRPSRGRVSPVKPRTHAKNRKHEKKGNPETALWCDPHEQSSAIGSQGFCSRVFTAHTLDLSWRSVTWRRASCLPPFLAFLAFLVFLRHRSRAQQLQQQPQQQLRPPEAASRKSSAQSSTCSSMNTCRPSSPHLKCRTTTCASSSRWHSTSERIPCAPLPWTPPRVRYSLFELVAFCFWLTFVLPFWSKGFVFISKCCGGGRSSRSPKMTRALVESALHSPTATHCATQGTPFFFPPSGTKEIDVNVPKF